MTKLATLIALVCVASGVAIIAEGTFIKRLAPPPPPPPAPPTGPILGRGSFVPSLPPVPSMVRQRPMT